MRVEEHDRRVGWIEGAGILWQEIVAEAAEGVQLNCAHQLAIGIPLACSCR
jgi:hypothetical protein